MASYPVKTFMAVVAAMGAGAHSTRAQTTPAAAAPDKTAANASMLKIQDAADHISALMPQFPTSGQNDQLKTAIALVCANRDVDVCNSPDFARDPSGWMVAITNAIANQDQMSVLKIKSDDAAPVTQRVTEDAEILENLDRGLQRTFGVRLDRSCFTKAP